MILIDSVVYGFVGIDVDINCLLMVMLIDSVVCGFNRGIDGEISLLWFGDGIDGDAN